MVNAGGVITDIEFNDVVIQLANNSPLAIAGCLPSAVQGEVPYEHTYTFDIAGNKLVQDKTKLRPVVVLINTRTGEAVNAEKIRISDITGIEAVEAGRTQQSVPMRFDLQGRRVGANYKGVVVSRSADGRVTKQLVR